VVVDKLLKKLSATNINIYSSKVKCNFGFLILYDYLKYKTLVQKIALFCTKQLILLYWRYICFVQDDINVIPEKD